VTLSPGASLRNAIEMLKRLRTLPRKDHLLYMLQVKRCADFANADSQFSEFLDVFLAFLFDCGAEYAMCLRSLVMLNKQARDGVLNELRRIDRDDVGFAYCRLADACEVCAVNTMDFNLDVWSHVAKAQVCGVRLCSECVESKTVELTPLFDPLNNGFRRSWRSPDNELFDNRITAPVSIDPRLAPHPMAREFVSTIAGEEKVVLLLPPGDGPTRFASGRLTACDARGLVAAFRPGLKQIDAEKRAVQQGVVDDAVRRVSAHLASVGCAREVYSIRWLTVEEVNDSPGHQGHWRSVRLELASYLGRSLRTRQSNLSPEAIEAFCRGARVHALHPSFNGWLQKTTSYGMDLVLELGRAVKAGGVRVRRISTTTWVAKRGMPREHRLSKIVLLEVRLPGAKHAVKLAAEAQLVDALECSGDVARWQYVPPDGLEPLGKILTSPLSRGAICCVLNPGHVPKKHRRCVHIPPLGAMHFWWVLTECSACGHH
jgi:hypothetical protein